MARFIPIVIPLTEARPDSQPGDPPKPTLYGRLTLAWLEFFRAIHIDLTAVEAVKINRWALADQVTLAAADAGYLAFVTDYGHLVRWTGTVWEFAPGDVGNRFVRFFVGAPQDSAFWQLMDGTATTYLTVGAASLTTTAFITPNVTAGTFIKVLAAFTGLIEAAIAPALSGSTAAEASHTHAAGAVSGNTQSNSGVVTGTTGAEAAHTHAAGTLAGPAHTHTFTTGTPSATMLAEDGTNETIVTPGHTHSGTTASDGTGAVTGSTAAGSSHTHGAGSLEFAPHIHGPGTLVVATSGAGSSHSHGAGTLVGDTAARPPSLGLLAYFRR